MTDAKDSEIERLKEICMTWETIVHNMVVANQSAWIEWKHGEGADAAMVWIENGLAGPGQIPVFDERWGPDAQLYYNANCADPFPPCVCGKPSRMKVGALGYCCEEHKIHHQAVLDERSGDTTGKILDKITEKNDG